MEHILHIPQSSCQWLCKYLASICQDVYLKLVQVSAVSEAILSMDYCFSKRLWMYVYTASQAKFEVILQVQLAHSHAHTWTYTRVQNEDRQSQKLPEVEPENWQPGNTGWLFVPGDVGKPSTSRAKQAHPKLFPSSSQAQPQHSESKLQPASRAEIRASNVNSQGDRSHHD